MSAQFADAQRFTASDDYAKCARNAISCPAIVPLHASVSIRFREEMMKDKLMPKRLIIKLTGLLFAAYSAFIIFTIIRDGRVLSAEAFFISVLVALLFGVLAGYARTSEVKDELFRTIRKAAMSSALIGVFALKLRMVGKVIAYLDFSWPQTVLYNGAYWMTQAALLILIIYYVFIRKEYPFLIIASVVLLLIAMILFLCSLFLEMILFFVYSIGLEPSMLRTAVSRPLFYLGFIGLSGYFMFPPRLTILPL